MQINEYSSDMQARRTTDVDQGERITFSEMSLSPTIVEGLKSAGFTKPSPIQLKAIPLGRLGL